MEHCAIDLGGRKSQICIRSSEGQIAWEERCETAALKERFRQWKPMRVVMETCAEAFGLADAALIAGHEVRVVPATLVRTLGVGARQTKTDRRLGEGRGVASWAIELPAGDMPSAGSGRLNAVSGEMLMRGGSGTGVIARLAE